MEFNINSISAVLGILGAYFSILLVMAVGIETILEPFTSLPWLRKKNNPDEILNEIKEWLPEGSSILLKAKTVEQLTANTKMTEGQLLRSVSDLKEITDDTIATLGFDAEMSKLRTDLALKFAALRRNYASSEKRRIAILRIFAAFIGVLIALFLHVNTFEILNALFPSQVSSVLSHPKVGIGGVLLTGLAASAGSSFWHDMLGRVRNVKDTVRQVEQFVK